MTRGEHRGRFKIRFASAPARRQTGGFFLSNAVQQPGALTYATTMSVRGLVNKAIARRGMHARRAVVVLLKFQFWRAPAAAKDPDQLQAVRAKHPDYRAACSRFAAITRAHLPRSKRPPPSAERPHARAPRRQPQSHERGPERCALRCARVRADAGGGLCCAGELGACAPPAAARSRRIAALGTRAPLAAAPAMMAAAVARSSPSADGSVCNPPRQRSQQRASH